MEITSRPNTGHSSLLTHIPQLTSSDAVETDNILQKHYLRVQQSLMTVVEKQVEEIETKFSEQEYLLKKTNANKELMGVELYGTKIQVGRLNNNLAKLGEKIKISESAEKCALLEKEAVDRQLQQESKQKKDVTAILQEKIQKVDELELKVKQLTEINTAYSSDLKIQTRIKNKLKKELEIAEQKRRDFELDLEEQKRKSESYVNEKKEVERLLSGQKIETMRAQDTIDKMNKEFNSLNELNKTFRKKWEDSLGAMESRDATLQTVQKTKSQLESNLLDAENNLRVCKLEKDEFQKKFREKELESQNQAQLIANLRGQLNGTEGKARLARNGMVESQVAESLYKQELEKLGKNHKIVNEELHRKNLAISELSNNLERLKVEFENKLRNEVTEKTAKKEQTIEQLAEAKIKSVTKEHNRDNINLRQENAELKLKMKNLEDQMHSSKGIYSNLKSKYDEVHGHYVKLYEEAKQLIYALERKEHDVNYLKSKLLETADGGDTSRTLNLSILKLQKELNSSNETNDHLQTMWLDSQKDNLKCKEELQNLSQKYQTLQTKLGITDVVKNQTFKQIDEIKQESIDSKFESAKLFNELKKLQPLVDELKQKNVMLERQLTETRLQMEENQINNGVNRMKNQKIR
ncbi:hypothetical protein HDU92_005295 [Lobulomyces angularis]|nr:hypothetical protein HDU92_005295 [Lobulomyces angularis]